jgi:hypothetical protein
VVALQVIKVNENTVPGGYKYGDLVLQVRGWTACSVKELLSLRNPKNWKPNKMWQNLLRKLWLKKSCFANDDDDDIYR